VSIRFGEFTLDAGRRQLSRAGQELHVSPKAFELLSALVDCRPRALSKAELLELVWPGTFVSEASLATVVAEIRSALGDTKRPSRFVRTVHGFGYAFQANAVETPAMSPGGAADHITFWIIAGTRQIPLAEGENVVGRDPSTAVCLDAPGVSRHHARIVVATDRVTVQDLHSKNGTSLRGEPVTATPIELGDHDVITFGSVDVKFRVWAPGGRTTETQNARQLGARVDF
jgi:DNA-binding winged helix-turn-helix (wHTH) protein